MATLNLKTPASAIPVFDHDDHYMEVHTPEGVQYVQLKNMFNRSFKFVKEAPPELQLAPLTAEQRRNLQVQRQKNAKFFGSAKPKMNESGIPKVVADAERENAKARAAEHQAA